MARRSRMSILKRQREVQKAEKAARKRARRLGQTIEQAAEPRPTEGFAELFSMAPADDAAAGSGRDDPDEDDRES